MHLLAFDFVHTDWPHEDVVSRLRATSATTIGDHARAALADTEATFRSSVGAAVEVEVEEPVTLGTETVVSVRWRSRWAPVLFPVMEGDLRVAPFPGGGTYFDFSGSYTPPLGSFGETLDRLALHRLASANARAILQRITASLDPDPTVSATRPTR